MFISKRLILVFIGFIFCSQEALGVPTSFLKSPSGNMRDVHWSLLDTKLFQVYYNEDALPMGQYALTSLEEGYPYLSRILGSQPQSDKITLVLSDRYESGGFANPVTENIEIQLLFPKQASFFQHELVHRLMYEHNDFHVGPLGRIFSLAMMPTWWIEGLAEYLTESVGPAETNALERSMSLDGNWPSWDRLHALYHSDDEITLRGYVTSGRFLGWIFSKSEEKDISKIHEQIAKKTITPFFYNAVNSWLSKNLGESGEELYGHYQVQKKSEWTSYLNGMPFLSDASSTGSFFSRDRTSSFYQNSDHILISNLVSNTLTSEEESSFFVKNEKTGSAIRIPSLISGSSVFDVDKPRDGVFVTAELQQFRNAGYGHRIRVVYFRNDIFHLENEDIIKQIVIPLSTEKTQYLVEQIKSAGNGLYFIKSNSHGNSEIDLLNLNDNSIKKIKNFNFPASVKLIGTSKQNDGAACAIVLLDRDKQLTSVVRVCGDVVSRRAEVVSPRGLTTGSRKIRLDPAVKPRDDRVVPRDDTIEWIPSGKLNIKDGYVLQNGDLRLLITWDKLFGVVDYHKGTIRPISAFAEWVPHISPWKSDDDFFGAWIYKKSRYEFHKIDVVKLKNNFSLWKKKQSNSSLFRGLPVYTPYEPPFVKIAGRILPAPAAQPQPTPTSADYDNVFLFAYPYGIPILLGGPSVNLAAIPIMDKMERYKVQIGAGYNFYLQAANGSVTYINNRFLDKFAVSLFSQPFFNGFYDSPQITNNVVTGTVRTYNYLQQNGVNAFGTWNFRPSSITLQGQASLSQLTSYPNLAPVPTSVGAQNTDLVSLVGDLSFNIFDTGFYLAKKENPNGRYLAWKTDADFGGGKFNSLNGSTDSLGNNSGNLDYYNLNVGLNSTFSAYSQSISLIGKISTTQGHGTFNLKEFYSPYQMYILGSTASLNYVSYPILNTSSLFDLEMGYWSYSAMAYYDFPILKKFESLFLISYINNWRGFLSFTEGGVGTATNLSSETLNSSANIGTNVTIDIKGYQLYPALIYSTLLGKNGWSLLMQVKFMDVF